MTEPADQFRAVVRVDASIQIGTGHVHRCLTLAQELKRSGFQVLFVCRRHEGNLCEYIRSQGFDVSPLPQPTAHDAASVDMSDEYSRWLGVEWNLDADQTASAITGIIADLIVVDHYALDHRWESRVRKLARRIMVIDDLANRRHDCDVLVDQNLFPDMTERYRGLVPDSCRLLLGPAYALLRPEFLQAGQIPRVRDGSITRILLFFGGADPDNVTGKALEGVRLLNRSDIAVDVVVGELNPNKDSIRQAVATMPSASYHVHVANMAELMVKADFAIGAAGTTTWERCYLGLPSQLVILAENQREVAQAVAEAGVGWNLGWGRDLSPGDFATALAHVLSHSEEVRAVSLRARELMQTDSGRQTLAVLPHLTDLVRR
jgi:UDP-2,4-diacetamido-2,4,6-trideoxy-beta-L-altropyranose hydrolase